MKEMTEKQRVFFERGFEEGYAIARRNYEVDSAYITTANGMSIIRSSFYGDKVNKGDRKV